MKNFNSNICVMIGGRVFYWQEAFDFSLSSECEEDKIGLLQPN